MVKELNMKGCDSLFAMPDENLSEEEIFEGYRRALFKSHLSSVIDGYDDIEGIKKFVQYLKSLTFDKEILEFDYNDVKSKVIVPHLFLISANVLKAKEWKG